MARPAPAPAPMPTLEDRIEAIHAEIEAMIEARVDEAAASAPGVPKDAIRRLIINRATNRMFCHCAVWAHLLNDPHIA